VVLRDALGEAEEELEGELSDAASLPSGLLPEPPAPLLIIGPSPCLRRPPVGREGKPLQKSEQLPRIRNRVGGRRGPPMSPDEVGYDLSGEDRPGELFGGVPVLQDKYEIKNLPPSVLEVSESRIRVKWR